MGLLDIFKGKCVDPTYPSVHAGGNIITTRLDAVVKWGRKSSLWPMPFGTACCAIEFMALSASHYDIARFGAEVLRFSPAPGRPDVRRRHDRRQAGARS